MGEVTGHLSVEVGDWLTWLCVVLTIAAGVFLGNFFNQFFK